MMKDFFASHWLLSLTAVCMFSCIKEEIPEPAGSGIRQTAGPRSTRVIGPTDLPDKIILGAQLNNPYSVRNMRLAADSLRKLAVGSVQVPLLIRATHYYVKFMPRTEDELMQLKQDTLLELYEYPLDHEIEQNGISYHDPELPDSLPTYQYASVEVRRWGQIKQNLPVAYEVLESLYIPDEDRILNTNSVDTHSLGRGTKNWNEIDALVDLAMAMTGNEEPAVPATRGSSKWQPSGTIRAYDNIVGDYVPLY